MKPFKMAPRLTRAVLLCATTLGALCETAAAAKNAPPPQDQTHADGQDNGPATPPPAAQTPLEVGDTQGSTGEDIVVTGYRSSLAKSTNDKRA